MLNILWIKRADRPSADDVEATITSLYVLLARKLEEEDMIKAFSLLRDLYRWNDVLAEREEAKKPKQGRVGCWWNRNAKTE